MNNIKLKKKTQWLCFYCNCKERWAARWMPVAEIRYTRASVWETETETSLKCMFDTCINWESAELYVRQMYQLRKCWTVCLAQVSTDRVLICMFGTRINWESAELYVSHMYQLRECWNICLEQVSTEKVLNCMFGKCFNWESAELYFGKCINWESAELYVWHMHKLRKCWTVRYVWHMYQPRKCWTVCLAHVSTELSHVLLNVILRHYFIVSWFFGTCTV
jgi:hypothetical protein